MFFDNKKQALRRMAAGAAAGVAVHLLLGYWLAPCFPTPPAPSRPRLRAVEFFFPIFCLHSWGRRSEYPPSPLQTAALL